MKTLVSILLGIATLCATSLNAAAEDAGRTIIVMDGSGSMWGQIDGVPKLEIARKAVADLVGEIGPEREVGLVAYGHRTRGDCSDIEVMVQPAPGAGGDIVAAVNAMRFQGRTPLSDAVRQGAEALRITENPATLVLVTDGLETCGADPCALGNELEAAGIDFTAHVVGFGLSKDDGAKVACLAENTGGRYIQAGNADALSAALAQTVLEEKPPAPKPVAALPKASLEAPASAPITTTITVVWQGPAGPDDYVDIVPANQPATRSLNWAYTRDGQPSVVRMPASPGDYLLRYVWASAQGDEVVATLPIAVTEAEFALDAPVSAEQGAVITVHWQGPGNEGDYIDVVEAGAERTSSELSYTYASAGNPLEIQVPISIGQYDLRYIVQGTEARAIGLAVPLTVMPTTARLIAPDQVQPGAEFPVRFSGPNSSGDWVDLVTPGFDAFSGELTYFYTRDTRGNENTLTAPDAPGRYELRYIVEGHDGRAVLARRPLEVSPSAPARLALPPAEDADAMPSDQMTLESGELDAGRLEPDSMQDIGLGDDVAYVCKGAAFCPFTDRQTGLSFMLPDGWITDFPTTEAWTTGGEPGLPRMNFMKSAGDTIETIVLNPHQWIASNGPCQEVSMGQLCYFESNDPTIAAIAAFIAQTLNFAPPAGMTGDMDPTHGPDEVLPAEKIGYRCEQDGLPCVFVDQATGIAFPLPPRWFTDIPWLEPAPAGGISDRPHMIFYSPMEVPDIIALNPDGWDEQAGPCASFRYGIACMTGAGDPANRAAFDLVTDKIRLTRPQDAAADTNTLPDPAAAVSKLAEQLKGQDPAAAASAEALASAMTAMAAMGKDGSSSGDPSAVLGVLLGAIEAQQATPAPTSRGTVLRRCPIEADCTFQQPDLGISGALPAGWSVEVAARGSDGRISTWFTDQDPAGNRKRLGLNQPGGSDCEVTALGSLCYFSAYISTGEFDLIRGSLTGSAQAGSGRALVLPKPGQGVDADAFEALRRQLTGN
ncbi:vWA domain-containing protein [Martelella limonii]|uniref:vWA domain-containing protein n=1 Tax=Martelella limonii TaxID=1647649 RepID=UPI001FCEA766|nr:VWA domain-containing protein [Martelella limonii]